MKIGYKKVWGAVILGAGVVNLVLVMILLSLGGRLGMAIVPALICVILGPMYFVRPYFRLEDDAFVVPALIGPAKRTVPFGQLGDVSFADGRFWVDLPEGGRKKVPVSRLMADGADWDALVARVEAARTF